MDVVIITAAVSFLLLAIGFASVFARLISRDRTILPIEESDPIFSPSRYRVVERLLAEADRRTVTALNDKEAEKKFREVRVKIFRGYMVQLSEDFNRTCKAIKLLMVTSDVDRSELAGAILKQQFRFSLSLMRIEVELTIYSLGWNGIDTGGLIDSVDALRNQLQGLVASAEPLGA
jgi:hypothetical protein